SGINNSIFEKEAPCPGRTILIPSDKHLFRLARYCSSGLWRSFALSCGGPSNGVGERWCNKCSPPINVPSLPLKNDKYPCACPCASRTCQPSCRGRTSPSSIVEVKLPSPAYCNGACRFSKTKSNRSGTPHALKNSLKNRS